MCRRLVFFGVVAVTVSMVQPAVASADNYTIDFGSDKSSCKSAAKKAKDAGRGDSNCSKTDAGTYTLYVSDVTDD